MLRRQPFAHIVFFSRWLQLPLYLGLIGVLGLYAWRFLEDAYQLALSFTHLSSTEMMVSVLRLVDIVFISNLLIMVIIGGYETFVSRLGLSGHPDEPEWLGHFSSGTLKIKLSLSLVSIASIQLLEGFTDVEHQSEHALMWQSLIFVLFLLSAVVMAYIDRLHTGAHKVKPRSS